MAYKGGGKPGNTNAVKLKDPDLRQEAYKQYCAHIASGLSKEAFCFNHPTIIITWNTLEKLIKENPVEFNPLLKEKAMSDQQALLESWCLESANGKNTKANTATLQMLMRNKFGWDRKDQMINPEMKESLDVFCESWEKARKNKD